MGIFQVRVEAIRPQRDEIKVKDGVLQDFEFWNSNAKGEDVVAFKRFVAKCFLEWGGREYPIEILFNIRSNFVRVIAKDCPIDAEMIAQGLVRDIGRYKVQGPRSNLESGGRTHRHPVCIRVHRADGIFEFATDDALWWCAALHDMSDHGRRDGKRGVGFSGEGILSSTDSPFRDPGSP